MNRRSTDRPGGQRREDALEALLTATREMLVVTQEQRDQLARMRKEGSDNFRAYRKRATFGFLVLSAASALALFLIFHNQQDTASKLQMQTRQTAAQLAQQTRDTAERLRSNTRRVTVESCRAGNDVRHGLRQLVRRTIEPIPQFERVTRETLRAFAARDCAAVGRSVK